jgi:formylglycine-generating enzyme required for sulfatase activity/tRNA A-37 threonylcarbamoyl transferase component Bud32
LLLDQRQRWQRGERAFVETFLRQHPALAADTEAVLDLIFQEIALRERRGESAPLEEYLGRFPHLGEQLRHQFEVDRALLADLLASEDTAVGLGMPGDAALDSGVQLVAGYEILSVLGRGGMGVVYKARQTALKRVVALKMVLTGGHAGAKELARFRIEAEAAARLQHPNIVQIYEVGEHDGQPYFSMEYVDGGSLAQRLDGTPQPAGDAACLTETLARAVHAAHQRGVIHRDLKPGNVLLGPGGEPKVADFGLAKRLDESGGNTRTNDILGTPSYMSPEQAGGRSKEVTAAADTYALGAILYELLTGRPPFLGETPLDTVQQILSRDPVPPRQLQSRVPRDLETVCLKCLEKDPRKRYPTALDLAEELRRFREGEPVQARPAGPVVRVVKWARRRPAVAALVALAGVLVVAVLGGWALYRWRARQAESAARARALVARLTATDTPRVPELVEELGPLRPWADPLLRDVLASANSDGPESLHASLALLPVDAGQKPFLARRLLRAPPADLLVLRGQLRPDAAGLAPDLWRTAAGSDEAAFCALGALAEFAPEDDRWAGAAPAVADRLVRENPLRLGPWLEVFRPARGRLLAALAAVFEEPNRPTEERNLATAILADYAADRPDLLVRLASGADAHRFALLWPPLQRQASQTVPLLRDVLAERPGADAADADRDALARRQANAAAALLRLGEENPAWPLLQHTPDPTVRSYLVHRLAALGVEPAALLRRFDHEPDASARRALLLALGEFPPGKLPAAEQQALADRLLEDYRTDPDPGTHSAIDWLLRQRWGRSADLERLDCRLAGETAVGRRWFVNCQGQTYAVVKGPVDFDMGSPESEPGRDAGEVRHHKRIPHSFALATRAVTVADFQRFLAEHPEVKPKYEKKFSPDPDGPFPSLTWYEAAAYCRWLSEKDHVPEEQMCYPPINEIHEGMTLPADYLHRDGYRLPTEAEWEYGCRAEAETSRFFGRSDELLDRYAWSLANARNRAWPVGMLKPNDLGLFDAHGNVWNWTQDRLLPYREGDDVEEDVLKVSNSYERVLRGGSFFVVAGDVRCAYRFHFPPFGRFYSDGLRPARGYRGDP